MSDRVHFTKSGYEALQAEARQLFEEERPQVVEAVSWAASNGDRSENGDYIYGKRRVREIGRRLRFLTDHLARAVVLDPAVHHGKREIYLGARVVYRPLVGGEAVTVQIVGVDEVSLSPSNISWRSPIGRALLKAQEGAVVVVETPQGMEEIEVLEVSYPSA